MSDHFFISFVRGADYLHVLSVGRRQPCREGFSNKYHYLPFKRDLSTKDFYKKCSSGSLLLQKTIKGIKFSKRSLEVVINLKDTNTLEVGGLVSNSLGYTGARIRAGASNSLTPACSSGSKLQNGTEGGSRTHNLVRGSVFETDAYASSATSAVFTK